MLATKINTLMFFLCTNDNQLEKKGGIYIPFTTTTTSTTNDYPAWARIPVMESLETNLVVYENLSSQKDGIFGSVKKNGLFRNQFRKTKAGSTSLNLNHHEFK